MHWMTECEGSGVLSWLNFKCGTTAWP